MKILSLTDIGPSRDSNQDAFDFGYFEENNGYAVVCDGMGGVSGGQIASSICIERVSSAIQKGYRKNIGIKAAKNLLESSIGVANAVIHEKAQEDISLKGMGTTVVAALVNNSIAVIAHVGDSRAYIVNGENVTQITKDHSLVQLMIDNNKITPEQAKTHPDKNIITRAVGVVNFVDVEFDIVDLKEGDKLLLCTDGLSGSLTDEDISKIIEINGELAAEALVKKAILNGSTDNVTAVLMF